MGGSSIEFTVQRRSKTSMGQLGPAWLQFIRDKMRELDEDGEFFEAMDWFLKDADIDEGDDFVSFGFSGASGTVQNLAEAASHVIHAAAHHCRNELSELLAQHGCALTGPGEGTAGHSLFDRFFEFRGTMAQAGYCNRGDEYERSYLDDLGKILWVPDQDGRLCFDAADERQVFAEDLRAPPETIYFTSDPMDPEDCGWACDLDDDEKDYLMHFYRAGICYCPICWTHTSDEVVDAQPLALAALEHIVEEFGFDHAKFRLRWNPIENLWAFIYVWPGGTGRELSRVEFSMDHATLRSSMGKAMVHGWVQPCPDCKSALLEVVDEGAGRLSCPKCSKTETVRDLYSKAIATEAEDLE